MPTLTASKYMCRIVPRPYPDLNTQQPIAHMETDDVILLRISSSARPFFAVTGGVLLQLTFGIVYTFGNMLPYLVSYLRWKVNPDLDNGSMIWIQSFMSGLPGAMIVGGIIERKVGPRFGAFLGSLIYTLSTALCYFSIQHSYFMLLVTMGLMQTFGYGVAYNCVLITAQKWLPHRVGLAGGLIVSGFGCGAFMISPIQTRYINPWNYSPNAEGFFTQPELLERVPQVFLVLAVVFAVIQMIGLLFIGERKEIPLAYEDDATLQRQEEQLTLKEILRSSTFAMLFITLLLNGVWVQAISGLYKAFGQQFVSDDFFLATISSFAAIFNCASRVMWGSLADKTSYQTSMVTACTIGCVLIWTLGLVQLLASPALLFIWVCGMFCCVGATYSLLPYASHKCFGAEHFGLVYGFIQTALTFSGIINALLSQFVLPRVGYIIHFLIIGSLLFASQIISAFINFSKHGSPKAISYERLE
ncbi:hypothetical protein QR680_001519 [Steinernema hermaphroditum]|uniref:Major facilitator superfamily (MFS) profile domain-containing protein n=1 Tax=Steinernema hermaphroditum TaxID=289476 RepID=A0AA39GYN1_9BILA|nr:hypothetical protein QR680_001519 [Steinernema hermaphroditum]